MRKFVLALDAVCLIRKLDGSLMLASPDPEDFRLAVVERLNLAATEYRMPDDADLALCDGLPVYDDAIAQDPVLYVL
jgi:hypothetical protein